MPDKPVDSVDAVADDAAFVVVGVGASAGGVEAFRKLLQGLDPKTNAALVLVLHMGETKSLLTEILSRDTSLPVKEIEDGMTVAPRTVYVMPSGVDMTIAKAKFHLTRRTKSSGVHTPIDIFFRSLAADRGIAAVGVVLTGADADGTQGLDAIKGAGGVTMVQDPSTAAYASMPQHAIDAKVADLVRPLEEMPAEIARLSVAAPAVPVAATEDAEGQKPAFIRILELLRRRTGVDFLRYKDSTIRRRIQRRMVILRLDSLAEYLRLLEEDSEEVDALYQDILIMVTQFFREPETFDLLRSEVFPNILQRKREDEPWRFWVVGCSSGQEAYSLGISLLEFFGSGSRPHVQIFATDINDNDIATARAGIYPPSIATEMTELQLRRYFEPVPEGYQVKKSLREMCIFAKHDVTRDPPFTLLDIVSCRNVLIYFGSQMQDRLIPLFHFALHSSGFLVLGSSESVGRHGSLFELVDKKNKIYARKPGRGELPFEFGQPSPLISIQTPSAGRPRATEHADLPFDIVREVDRIAAGAYAPASVVVGEDLRILHFRGDTSAVLAHPPGAASFDLIQMARDGLGPVLRDAISDAKLHFRTVRRTRIPLQGSGGPARLDLAVIPFRGAGDDTYFLVSFEQKEAERDEEPPASEDEDESRLLRDELLMTREHLQTVIRDKEAALEELRAAYEEIQSSNEELQSINEELETAKEELQSINEELTTVNDELQLRNQDLTRAHDDLRNLLANIDVPILMLDQDLKIRSYTPATERLLHVLPGDIGRPLADFRMSVHVPDLEGMIRRSIDEVTAQEKEARDETGNWYSIHVRPYRTGDMRIGGAVISFQDVTELKKSVDVSREAAKLSDVLSAISGIVGSQAEPKEIIPQLIRAAAGALEAPVGFLVVGGKDGWTIDQVLRLPMQLVGRKVTWEELPTATRARREKSSVWAHGEAEGLALLSDAGITSTLAIPFPYGEDEQAVLVLGYRRGEHEVKGATAEFTDRLVLTLTLAMENVRFRQADRGMAESMRADAMPNLVAIKGVETGHASTTAQMPERVGGDFLDIVPMETGVLLVSIGDVAGHGLQAAHLAGLARAGVRMMAQIERSPAQVLKHLNTALRTQDAGSPLITACLAILDLTSRTALVACAGHQPPVLLTGTAASELVIPSQPPLGAAPKPTYSDTRIELAPGDRLVVFTDGITEARSDGEEFGLPRLLSLLTENNKARTQAIADTILQAAVSFAGGTLVDDATVGVLQVGE